MPTQPLGAFYVEHVDMTMDGQEGYMVGSLLQGADSVGTAGRDQGSFLLYSTALGMGSPSFMPLASPLVGGKVGGCFLWRGGGVSHWFSLGEQGPQCRLAATSLRPLPSTS